MSIKSYLKAIPKAELHVHLEGSIRPSTLLELAKYNGVELPANSVEGLRDWFTYRDFDHFVEIYVACTRCLRTTADYELIVHELGEEMYRQNVRYAEVTFSPSTHWQLGVHEDSFLDGLALGRERALADFGVEINWVFDIVRVSDASRRERLAEYTTRLAIEAMDRHVVALGLGGVEASVPPEPYAPWFELARSAGLHSTPHAGETAGPESVWGALRSLGAERIGHGVRSIEDPLLVQTLAERRFPLEVCPTSNIRLGVYESLATHPMRRLHDAGVVVTVNSDDPPLFNTTLNDEYLTLTEVFGFDIATIDEIALNGVRYSFLGEEQRAGLEASFRAEMERLKAVHLNDGACERDE